MDKEKAKDIGYALIKGAIGALPFAGASASELLSVLIASPLERRRVELFTSIGERLSNLEQNGRIDLNKLKGNELFVDVVLQVCQHALKTSDTDKIIYYKNVIENTALGEAPDKVVSQVYLNAIDRYTSWHVKILVLLATLYYGLRLSNLISLCLKMEVFLLLRTPLIPSWQGEKVCTI